MTANSTIQSRFCFHFSSMSLETLRKCSFDSFVHFFSFCLCHFGCHCPTLESLLFHSYSSMYFPVLVLLLVFGTFNFFFALSTLRGIARWNTEKITKVETIGHEVWKTVSLPNHILPNTTLWPDTHRPRNVQREREREIEYRASMLCDTFIETLTQNDVINTLTPYSMFAVYFLVWRLFYVYFDVAICITDCACVMLTNFCTRSFYLICKWAQD